MCRKDAEKEIKRMERIFNAIQVIDENEVLTLARSYFEDSKYFFKKEEYLKAFEAVVISWAYVDSLLHFQKISIPGELLKFFTVQNRGGT